VIIYKFKPDTIFFEWYIAFGPEYDEGNAKLVMRSMFEGIYERVRTPPPGTKILGVVRRTGEGPRLRREDPPPPPNPTEPAPQPSEDDPDDPYP